MNYWSVRWDHQDADWAKRSIRPDFETQQAMNQCSSQSHQETWWARDQSNNNRHSRRDYHQTMRESLESKKETAFSKSILISIVYKISSFYQELYLMKVIYFIQQWSSQVLQVFELIYIHWWR